MTPAHGETINLLLGGQLIFYGVQVIHLFLRPYFHFRFHWQLFGNLDVSTSTVSLINSWDSGDYDEIVHKATGWASATEGAKDASRVKVENAE